MEEERDAANEEVTILNKKLSRLEETMNLKDEETEQLSNLSAANALLID